MPIPTCLLLASHGTRGAARAEALAFAWAVPGVTTLVHALVVPDFWDGMQGDDWLNNSSTRDAFARHLEGQLEKETAAQLQAIERRCMASGIAHRALVEVGEPASCLVAMAEKVGADWLVIGPPRPKGESGFNSRVKLETLVRSLRCPLIVAR